MSPGSGRWSVYGAVMDTLHIGGAGELLVQYQLLKLGIDSARLTTDAGVDLVVYASATRAATTIQVKTKQKPLPAGGKGRPALGWTFPNSCPAQVLALARLDKDRVWLFTLDEARRLAQQHSPNDRRQIYWYASPDTAQHEGIPRREADMDEYLLTVRAPRLFPG